MTDKTKGRLALAANGIILVATAIIATAGILFGAGNGQLGTHVIGLGYLRPFTMDSNILAGIASLITVICLLRSGTLPRWVTRLRLMATTGLFLTLVTVACFLAPMEVSQGHSYFMMFEADMLFFHLIDPLLAIVSFIRWEPGCRLRRRECPIGALPVVLYAGVYFTMVVVLRRWEDFYGFTLGGRMQLIPIVLVVILGLALLISLMLILLRDRNGRSYP